MFSYENGALITNSIRFYYKNGMFTPSNNFSLLIKGLDAFIFIFAELKPFQIEPASDP